MRSRSSAVLLALAVAALLPSLGVAQYAPKWHVGDWWVVKTLVRSMDASDPTGPDWIWNHTRYDVVGVERVSNHDCFVLKVGYGGPYDVFYVRKDNWLIVRNVRYYLRNNRLLPPDTIETPQGLYGAFMANEPRLPRFPLQLRGDDTLFRLKARDYGAGYLREVSGGADSAFVNRLLNEGDSAGGRVVRPTGAAYEIRMERGEGQVPGSQTGDSPYGRILQSQQLWSEDQPWRVYEGLATFYQTDPMKKRVAERSWLVASGHGGK